MSKALKSGLFACLLAAAPASALAEKVGQDPSVGDKVGQAIDKAMERLQRLIEETPMYEAPEITPEGDIIIRKRRPTPDPLPKGHRRI